MKKTANRSAAPSAKSKTAGAARTSSAGKSSAGSAGSNGAATIERRSFAGQLVAACPRALVITGLGSSSYDVFAGGDRPENFYLWGAMGGAAVMALGVAIAQPKRPVLVITGDGEQLMGLGALATIGAQRSHTSQGTNLAAVARACGIADASEMHKISELPALAARINARSGCLFTQVRVRPDDLPRILPPRDGVYLKNRFREVLGFAPM